MRVKGTRNKLPLEVRAFCKSVVESPTFQAKLRERAEKGTLSGTELTLILAYAVGKPKDVIEVKRQPERPMAKSVALMTPDELQMFAGLARRMIAAKSESTT